MSWPNPRAITTAELETEVERRGLRVISPEALEGLLETARIVADQQEEIAELTRARDLLRAGLDDRVPMYLQILREITPALVAISAIVLLGGAVGVPLAVWTGTIEGNTADVAGATALGMGAGAVAMFLLAARWSAGAIRDAEDRAEALAERKRYADARLREIRMIADEVRDTLVPGSGLSVACRTIGHLAHDAIAGHVVLEDPHTGDEVAATADTGGVRRATR